MLKSDYLFSDIRVGDKVWCSVTGKSFKVTHVTPDSFIVDSGRSLRGMEENKVLKVVYKNAAALIVFVGIYIAILLHSLNSMLGIVWIIMVSIFVNKGSKALIDLIVAEIEYKKSLNTKK